MKQTVKAYGSLLESGIVKVIQRIPLNSNETAATTVAAVDPYHDDEDKEYSKYGELCWIPATSNACESS
jgi:hypothetical protein